MAITPSEVNGRARRRAERGVNGTALNLVYCLNPGGEWCNSCYAADASGFG